MVVLREDQDIAHYAMQVCAKPIFEKVTHTRMRREQQSGVEEQKIRQQTAVFAALAENHSASFAPHRLIRRMTLPDVIDTCRQTLS